MNAQKFEIINTSFDQKVKIYLGKFDVRWIKPDSSILVGYQSYLALLRRRENKKLLQDGTIITRTITLIKDSL